MRSIVQSFIIFFSLFNLLAFPADSSDYRFSEARQSFEYKFNEWNNRKYQLTGRLILITKSKAIIHLPRRNYGYTKFIYTNIDFSEDQITTFQKCKNLCFFSGDFSFSGNRKSQFGSEYQIDSNLSNFELGLNEALISQNRRLFSDLRKLRDLFSSSSEKNDGRYPPTFFFEFSEDEEKIQGEDDT